MEWSTLLLPSAGFLAFAALVLWFAVRREKRARLIWKGFAEKHGLIFSGGRWTSPPAIAGKLKGVKLRIEVLRSGRHRNAFTRYRAFFRSPMPADLHVSSEGIFDKVAKALGGQDIQIGIERVDATLRIKGSDEAAVRRLFSNPVIRQALLDFVQCRDGSVSELHATLQEIDLVADPEKLAEQANAVVDMVETIERALGTDSEAGAKW